MTIYLIIKIMFLISEQNISLSTRIIVIIYSLLSLIRIITIIVPKLTLHYICMSFVVWLIQRGYLSQFIRVRHLNKLSLNLSNYKHIQNEIQNRRRMERNIGKIFFSLFKIFNSKQALFWIWSINFFLRCCI